MLLQFDLLRLLSESFADFIVRVFPPFPVVGSLFVLTTRKRKNEDLFIHSTTMGVFFSPSSTTIGKSDSMDLLRTMGYGVGERERRDEDAMGSGD